LFRNLSRRVLAIQPVPGHETVIYADLVRLIDQLAESREHRLPGRPARNPLAAGGIFLGSGLHPDLLRMFADADADAFAIRTAFEQEGELSAAIELRRQFPGIIDNAKARQCARSVAGRTPPAETPTQPATVTPLRPAKRG
jgi:hypothetical protein